MIKKQPKIRKIKQTKFKWVEKKSDELSSKWKELPLAPIKWVYVVDAGVENPSLYSCYLVFETPPRLLGEVRITTKEFKTQSQAMKFCEKHLLSTYEKLQKLFL